jgi:hypothetical protein
MVLGGAAYRFSRFLVAGCKIDVPRDRCADVPVQLLARAGHFDIASKAC